MNRKIKLIVVLLVMGIAISLNFLSLIQAYPEAQKIDSGCCAPKGALLAKDFSAFYFGAWNLIHNTSQIYVKGSSVNASFLGIDPHPESFKYLPSFLILILPFLLLNYNEALRTFDAIQFAMLFLIAFLIYKLLERKNIAIMGIVSIIALLLPFTTNLSWGISEAYFWQWAEGQDKVLDLALILLAFYFGIKHRPVLSGIFFGLSFFDSRFFLVSIPLFLTLNKGSNKRAASTSLSIILLTNVPFLVFPGVFGGFLAVFVSEGVTTPLYPYSYITLLTILGLSLAKGREIVQLFSRRRNSKVETDPELRNKLFAQGPICLGLPDRLQRSINA